MNARCAILAGSDGGGGGGGMFADATLSAEREGAKDIHGATTNMHFTSSPAVFSKATPRRYVYTKAE